jgi:DNA-binding PadR family transcriptional regulator
MRLKSADDSGASASDIARLLSAQGQQVAPTNIARAFRQLKADKRAAGLWVEKAAQRYAITTAGMELLKKWVRPGT